MADCMSVWTFRQTTFFVVPHIVRRMFVEIQVFIIAIIESFMVRRISA